MRQDAACPQAAGLTCFDGGAIESTPWIRRCHPRPCRLGFSTLTANELLDLVVALADLYHLPGDDWMRLHSSYCTVLAEEYSEYQMRLLMQAYKALDAIDETYYVPLKHERY